jgi:hypothetical protein
MIPRLTDYVNQSILVSIPALHSDLKCRAYTLMAVELQGLWLHSEELQRVLTPAQEGETAVEAMPAFVSFSHIAFVVLPAPVPKIAGFSASLRGDPAVAAHAQAAAARAAERKRGRDAHKDSETAHHKKRAK